MLSLPYQAFLYRLYPCTLIIALITCLCMMMVLMINPAHANPLLTESKPSLMIGPGVGTIGGLSIATPLRTSLPRWSLWNQLAARSPFKSLYPKWLWPVAAGGLVTTAQVAKWWHSQQLLSVHDRPSLPLETVIHKHLISPDHPEHSPPPDRLPFVIFKRDNKPEIKDRDIEGEAEITAQTQDQITTYFKNNFALDRINQWTQELDGQYHQITDQHLKQLAKKHYIAPEHVGQLAKSISIHRQHLSDWILPRSLYDAFVLDLSDQTKSQISRQFNIPEATINQLVASLSGELAIYSSQIPRHFEMVSQLKSYQQLMISAVLQFEQNFFGHSQHLHPLKSHYLKSLASSQNSSPFSSKTEWLLFRSAHLGLPITDRKHLWALLELSPKQGQVLEERHTKIGWHFLTRPINRPHQYTLKEEFFYLSADQIRHLYARFYDALHLKSLSKISFYHELRSFYQQIPNELDRQLFLTFVVHTYQPSLVSVRQIADHYHLNANHDRSHTSNFQELHSSGTIIRNHLNHLMRSLTQWFQKPYGQITQDFDDSHRIESYFQHRLTELTEHHTASLARHWGITPKQQRLLFPMKMQSFIKTQLHNSLDFNVFCAYILHWNPLPIHKLARLHGVNDDTINLRSEQLLSQFQSWIHDPQTGYGPTRDRQIKPTHKILESLHIKFSQLTSQAITELITTQKFDLTDPGEFLNHVEGYLEQSSLGVQGHIIFLAKVLGLSHRSYLEWDHIFHKNTQDPLPSLMMHLSLEKSFRSYIQSHNHRLTQP